MKKSFLILLVSWLAVCASYAQPAKEDFDAFLFKFTSDEQFQLIRIKFPLEYKTWKDPESIGGEIIIKKIAKENWEHDFLYASENHRAQIFDNFKGALRDTDERLFQWIGVENGIDVKYFFRRIEGKWFLIKMEALGD